jgi:secreted PhoX family phosphatase
MLAVVGEPGKNLETVVCGDEFDTEWVDITDPDTDVDHGVFNEGFAAGGARFRRLEGCWFGLGKVYFLSTTGGPSGEGQVFEYDPETEHLRVIFHSAGAATCENPDNLVVTPRGAIILCEDNSGGTPNSAERLLGLTLAGEVFTFAQNNMDFSGAGLGNYLRTESGILYTTNLKQNEWAGACFSGDGQWLFVNIQTPGVTFAITGPWADGPF